MDSLTYKSSPCPKIMFGAVEIMQMAKKRFNKAHFAFLQSFH